ncbi:MAG: ribosome maturation factor RimP [Pyrinomonadaceae bacterium]
MPEVRNRALEEKSAAIAKVEGFALDSVSGTNIEVVHVELSGSGREKILRIFIDREDGITHEDCALVSERVSQKLDESDPLKGAYLLEVSSPGIERGLYSVNDFKKFAGRSARIKTSQPVNGQKNFRGEIVAVEDQTIFLNDVTTGRVQIEFEIVKKANLEYDDSLESNRSRS